MAVTLQRRDGRRHADGEWGKSRRSEPKSGQGGAVHESKNSRSFGSWILGSRLAFAFFSSTPAAPHKANVPAAPEANALPATPSAGTPAEPHPQIREALAALRQAKEHMEHAAHDFGGHRVEALKATDEAIRQLEMCLKYDKD
ncbi:MAG: hypothetical protein DMG41_29500 [Acidobacteria bacterium]|nr:MAG: hypothetical protein AUH13_27710 [Acidobacteria bacterium 13_2_20CM_58_27]PYT63618.1 MAG: hypothetical protein DMG42_36005 [Acidobacteriota bacterium]PYT83896.1 MAG: hypothetical protein DMG41_29500 [Acidobacteriota bacterium]